MNVLALPLAFVLLAPARAQIAPAEPTPDESARAIGVQAAKDPAAASAALNDLFRRLSLPRVVLPTWQEVQQDRLRRDLVGAPARPAPSDASTVDRAPIDPQGRTTRESVEATLSRPLPRVGLGVGCAQTAVDQYDERLFRDQAKFLFLGIDLSRIARPPRLLAPPVVDHDLIELAPSRVRVRSEEFVVDSLKLPKN
jgi:hypothetical protein